MKRRSFLGWIIGGVASVFAATPLAAAAPAEKEVPVDVTSFKSHGVAETMMASTAKAHVEVGDIYLKCGHLEVYSPSGMGRDTTLLIDGRPVAAKSVTLSVDIKGCWKVSFEYMPCIGLYGEKSLGREPLDVHIES